MVRIDSITLRNLFGFDEPKNILFLDTNYVVGPNNSGKTNLLRTLRLVESMLTGPERLQLSQRHLKKKTDSLLEIDLTFTQQEAEVILKFLTFPRSEQEAKLDIGDSFMKLFPDFDRAKLTISWPYDGSRNGTYPRGNIYFEKTGVRVDLKASSIVRYYTEETKSYENEAFDSTLRTIMEFAKKDNSSDSKKFFERGFHIEGVSPPKYRYVYVSRINNSSDYASYGPQHALFVSELIRTLGYNRLSSETIFDDLIGSFFRKKILFTSELRSMQEKPLGTDETLHPEGSNLANYLFHLSTNKDNNLQKLYGKVCTDFSQIFESNKISLRVILDPVENFAMSKREVTNTPKIYVYDELLQDQLPLENVGSGIFEIIYLLARSLTESGGVIVLDEPALHLHPVQINVFKRFLLLNAKASNNQLIIISHSPAFIGKDIVEKNTQIIYFRRRNGITEIKQVADEDKQWIQEHLPKLRFEFNPNIFFARSVVLVEGDADVGFLEGCASRHKLDFERSDVVILPVSGKTNFYKLMKLLRMYSIPCVTMSDRDSLMEIFSDSFSPLLHAAKELDPKAEDVEKMLQAARGKVVPKVKEPWWIIEVKKEVSPIKSSDLDNAIRSLTNRHDHSTKVYDDSIFQELSAFFVSRDAYVIQQGEIEDLLKVADPDLFGRLGKQYGKRNTRLFAREFVEQVDASKLPLLEIGKRVLSRALSLAN